MSVFAEIAAALKGGIVRQDVMFIEDVWYGERVLGSETGSAADAAGKPREGRMPPPYPEGTTTLMDYLEEKKD